MLGSEQNWIWLDFCQASVKPSVAEPAFETPAHASVKLSPQEVLQLFGLVAFGCWQSGAEVYPGSQNVIRGSCSDIRVLSMTKAR